MYFPKDTVEQISEIKLILWAMKEQPLSNKIILWERHRESSDTKEWGNEWGEKKIRRWIGEGNVTEREKDINPGKKKHKTESVYNLYI